MVRNKIKKLQFGFTLFEMIIVVALIAIITGISFSYYGKYAEGKKLEGEAKKLANTISLALKNSSSSNQESCNNFIGFKINFETLTKWTLQRCCNTAINCTAVAEFNLENNIEIESTIPSNLTSILFNKLGASLLFSPTQTASASITLKNNALESKNCINLNINQAGVLNIDERGPCSP